MARRTAPLYNISLFHDAGHGQGHFVIEISIRPERRRIKCVVVEWPTGELENIETNLSRRRMPVTHTEGKQSFFWARTKDSITAIGLVIEAFEGQFQFEPPEFWFCNHDDKVSNLEFRLEDRSPHNHTSIAVQPTNWRNDQDDDKDEQYEQYAKALRESGLCVPSSVLIDNGVYYLTLTSKAAGTPLETFQALIDLHPELATGAKNQRRD